MTSEQDIMWSLENLNQAISLNPYDFAAYYMRGLVHYRKGEYDLAIGDFTKTIGLKHDFYDAYYNRGMAHRKNGDEDRAIKDFDKARRLCPDDPFV